MSLTSFQAEFLEYFSVIAHTNELATLLPAAAKQAVRRISKYKPRLNQRANIAIAVDDTFALMPPNFQSASVSDLYKLKTGQALINNNYAGVYLDIWGSSIFYLTMSQNRFTADGRVIYYGSNYDSSSELAQQEALQLFQNDTGQWGIYLDAAATSARTELNFNYAALHSLTDDVYNTADPPVLITPALDTISGDLRDVLLDEVMNLALSEKGRQMAIAAKDRYQVEAAQLFINEAKKYGQAIWTIRPTAAAM